MTITPYAFRIIQTPAITLIVYESGEGDTFVINTVGINGKAWLDESGLPNTESLHVLKGERVS